LTPVGCDGGAVEEEIELRLAGGASSIVGEAVEDEGDIALGQPSGAAEQR